MKTDLSEKYQKLQIHLAMSLQNGFHEDISDKQLSDFITGDADAETTQKVMQALNASPSLMQQWLEIDEVLQSVKQSKQISQTQNKSFSIKQWLLKPWMVPLASAMLLAVYLLPVFHQFDANGFIQQQYISGNTKGLELSFNPLQLSDINSQSVHEIFAEGLRLGQIHWQYYTDLGEAYEFPDACSGSELKKCQEIYKLGQNTGQLTAIAKTHCHENISQQFWQDFDSARETLIQQASKRGIEKSEISDLETFSCN